MVGYLGLSWVWFPLVYSFWLGLTVVGYFVDGLGFTRLGFGVVDGTST